MSQDLLRDKVKFDMLHVCTPLLPAIVGDNQFAVEKKGLSAKNGAYIIIFVWIIKIARTINDVRLVEILVAWVASGERKDTGYVIFGNLQGRFS